MNTKTSKTLITTHHIRWTIGGTIVQLQINNEPLLKRLEKKIRANIDSNLSYKTNVYAGMTHWDLFKQDNDFKNLLQEYMTLCGEAGIYSTHYDKVANKYHFLVQNAWGTLMKKNDWVKSHHHLGTDFASVLYFDSHAPLNTDAGNFPTRRGLIITIPSYCFHSVAKITKDITRCSLAWNWTFTKSWDAKDSREEDITNL